MRWDSHARLAGDAGVASGGPTRSRLFGRGIHPSLALLAAAGNKCHWNKWPNGREGRCNLSRSLWHKPSSRWQVCYDGRRRERHGGIAGGRSGGNVLETAEVRFGLDEFCGGGIAFSRVVALLLLRRCPDA